MSWGSGANAWGPEKEDKFTKPNHWDGMLEVRFPFKSMKNQIKSIQIIGGWSARGGPPWSDPIRSSVCNPYRPGERV